MKKYFITTALPYVNAPPHLGWALEIVQADVIARYHRLLGEDVFFLTGTDENSLKNVQTAKREGISVKKLVNQNAQKFFNLKYALNLSFDDFIRTTEKRHINGAQKLWKACEKDIYKKLYRGLYCVGCEEFYKETELINGLCPEHRIKPELVEEENYFFKLTNYQDVIRKVIEHDEIEIIPKVRKNEVLAFIKSGLQDFCISRSAKRAQGWGIEVPGDSDQIIWVWLDALSNYINAAGFPDNPKKFKKWWPADVQVIGKGIIRFHAIYWPALLISAGLPLPKKIFVHGYLTVDGAKISKSLGNVIDPFELVKKYGTDSVRYFLLREIPPTEDGDFTYFKFEGRYNSDLANGLGNLVARVLTLAESTEIRQYSHIGIKSEIDRTWKSYKRALENFQFNEALRIIWDLISFCDGYIERERPWEIDTDLLLSIPRKIGKVSLKKRVVISNLLFALANIACLLQPFLPETAEKIFNQLGIKTPSVWPLRDIRFKIKKESRLFPKININELKYK